MSLPGAFPDVAPGEPEGDAPAAPEEESPFDHVRARSLIAWPLVALLLFLVLEQAAATADAGTLADPVSDALFYLGWGGWVVYRARRAGISLRALAGPPPRAVRTWGLVWVALPLAATSVGAIYLQLYALSYLAPGVVRFFLAPEQGPPDAGWALRGLGVLATVALAPVVEELVFRGLVLRRWERKWGIRASVLGTSLAFAVLHADLLGSLLFGIVMAGLYLRSGTLLLPIATHALYNACAEFMGGVGGAPDTTLYTLEEFRGEWPVGAALLAGGLSVVLAVLYTWRREGVWRLPGSV